eukprot:Ihof_evm3s69 gene=Ihof_evmTU3s69
MTSVDDFLSQHVLAELIIHHRTLVTIDYQATVEDTLKLLRRHNISSLPMVKDGEIKGIVSTLDLLAYVAFAGFGYQEEPTPSELQDFKFLNTPVCELIGVGSEIKRGMRDNWLFTFGGDTTLREIFDPMTIGIQRVLVRSDNDPEYKMVTQSDLLHFMYMHESRMHDYLRKNVGELDMGTTKPNIVSVNTKTLHALRELYLEDSTDALAVVDEEGKLVAHLSTKNVNHITFDNILDVLLPLGDFLRKMNHGYIYPTVCMTKDQSLCTAMAKVILGRIYCVWIVDDNNIPIGQITVE